MKKVKILFFLIFSGLSISGCGWAVTAKDAKDKIVYKPILGSTVDVFDVSHKTFYKGILEINGNINDKDGEVGGIFDICSNAEFYCIDGGIHFAVPKGKIGETDWKFKGKTCNVYEKIRDDYKIICKFSRWSTKFHYNKKQGIISYTRSTKPLIEYFLVGNEGLFSNVGNFSQ